MIGSALPHAAPHKSYVAFRYAAPMTGEALAAMQADGVTRAVALSLYPQYSCSTSGSSLNDLHAHLHQAGSPLAAIPWSVIDRWPIHPGLVEAFARHVEQALQGYPEAERAQVVLLFSAHSLPMSVVNRGGRARGCSGYVD
jgi:ferrochelatase